MSEGGTMTLYSVVGYGWDNTEGLRYETVVRSFLTARAASDFHTKLIVMLKERRRQLDDREPHSVMEAHMKEWRELDPYVNSIATQYNQDGRFGIHRYGISCHPLDFR